MLILAQSPTARTAADFTYFYGAAMLVREGHPAEAYRQPALDEEIRDVAPGSAIDRQVPFGMPLPALLPLVPLTLMPLELAFRTWQLISIGILIVALAVLQRAFPMSRAAPVLAFVGVLASAPAWAMLTEGQLTPLPLLGWALLTAAMRAGRLWPAAVGGILLAVKPQFLPIALIMLVTVRQWRPLLAAAGGATAMLLSPVAAGGAATIDAMVRGALATNQHVPVGLTEAWIGLLSALLPAAAVTLVSLGLYMFALAILSALGIPPHRTPLALAALIGWVGMLASPHALPHDLMLLLPATWLALWVFRQARLPIPLPALLLVDMALLVDLRGAGIVIGPIAMTGVVIWAAWKFRRQAAQQRPPQTAAAA